MRSETRKLSVRGAEEERQGPSSLCQALHSSVHHLEQLRQQLEEVQSAVQALDHFLSTVREVKAALAKQDPSRQHNEADWEQQRHCWQAAMQQRLQTAAEQSVSVDSSLKAAGMTLTMEGAAVTCQDVVTSVSRQAVDVETKMVRKSDGKELNPIEMCQIKPGDDSPHRGGAEERLTPSRMEEEPGMEAKRSRLEGDDEAKTQREEEHKAKKSEEDVVKAKEQRRGRSSQVKKEGEQKEVQRRVALLGTLREIRGAAEQLRLQEPTLPALQHRYNIWAQTLIILSSVHHINHMIHLLNSSPTQL